MNPTMRVLAASLVLASCAGEVSGLDLGGGGGAGGGEAGGAGGGSEPPVAAPDAGAPLAAPLPRGTWTRLDSGGGPWGAYFYRSVVLGNGDVWMAWGSPANQPARGNFIFRAATRTWTLTNQVVGDPTRNIGSRENYGAWFDADRNSVWIGNGAPVAYGFPNGPQCGDLRYDVAADRFTQEFPDFGTAVRAIGKGDGALVYWRNALYAFGGWSVGPQQGLVRHDLATGAITRLAAASTPPFTQGPARLSYARSGVMRSTGQLWTLADDGELYLLDTAAAVPEWVRVPTTGDKPGRANFGAALHEASGTLVTWLGRDGMVGADFGPEVGETRLLDLATRTWRLGPRLADGDPVPQRAELAVTVMNEDPLNGRIVLTTSSGVGTQVWAFVP